MKRRDVFKLGTMFILAANLPRIAFAQAAPLKIRKNIQVRFTNGLHSAALPDGSWNLWVRCAPKDKKVNLIKLLLQVATDSDFNSVISEQIHVARKESSYILRLNFSTKVEAPELFYRFVAVDSKSNASPDRPKVSQTGILAPFDSTKGITNII